MTKKIPAEEKLNRKPISRACVFCHEKHLQCDIGRPCQNCVKRNLDSSCRDNIRKPRKKRTKYGYTSSPSSRNKRILTDTGQRARTAKLEKLGGEHSSLDEADVIKKEETNEGGVVQDSNSQVCSVGPNVGAGMVGLEKQRGEAEGLCKIPSLTALFTSEVDPIIHDEALLPEAFSIGNRNLRTDVGGEIPTSGLESSNAGLTAFGSTWASNEYMKLNEILGTPYTEDLGPLHNTGEEVASKVEDGAVNPSAFPKTASMVELTADTEQFPRVSSRMHISLDMAYLTSSYQNSDGTTLPSSTSENASKVPKLNLMSPYALRQLIRTPEDLYKYQESIVPHNYREAYQDLLSLLRERFLDNSAEAAKTGWKKLQTIAQSIKIHYAPIFVTLTSNLIEGDLRMQEFILQRTLLEYEGMSKMVNCIPMCIWRRSGELCYASNEFISLTGYSRKEVLSKRRFIMEYFDNDSIVEYFKMFNEYLAFSSKKGIAATSDGQAIFSDCNLLLSSGLFLKCACIWTVKRDSFNIPMLIMGQFLPVLDDHYT